GLKGPDAEDGSYEREAAGTSFSAPLVAGAAALMLAVQPGLSVEQLIQGLADTSQHFPVHPGRPACGPADKGNCNCQRRDAPSDPASTCGAGMLNAAAAVAWAADLDPALATFTDSTVTAPYFTPVRGGQP